MGVEDKGLRMLREFREFAMKGNVVDLAVGVIIGAAFGGIVQSLVADIIMPIVGALAPGGLDFSNYFVSLSSKVGRLENLRELYLSNNPLTSLPDSIGDLESLRILDASRLPAVDRLFDKPVERVRRCMNCHRGS